MGRFSVIALGILGLIALLPLSSNTLSAIEQRDSFLAQVFSGDARDIASCQLSCDQNAALQMQACQIPKPDTVCLQNIYEFRRDCDDKCRLGMEAALRAEAEAATAEAEAQRQAKIQAAEEELAQQLALRAAVYCTQTCEATTMEHEKLLSGAGTDVNLVRRETENTFNTCMASCSATQRAAPLIDNQLTPNQDGQVNSADRKTCQVDCNARYEIWKKECGTSCDAGITYRKCIAGCFGQDPDPLPKLEIDPILESVDSPVLDLVKPITPCTCGPETITVCGSDGKAYQNPCLAACAGITTITPGKCGASSDPPSVTLPSPSPAPEGAPEPAPSQGVVIEPVNPVIAAVKTVVTTMVEFIKGVFGGSDQTPAEVVNVAQPASICPASITMNAALIVNANVKIEGGKVPTNLVVGTDANLAGVILEANSACADEARNALEGKASKLDAQYCTASCVGSHELTNVKITGCDIPANAIVASFPLGEHTQGVWKGTKGIAYVYMARAIGTASATFTPFCAEKRSSGAVNPGTTPAAPAKKSLPANAKVELQVRTRDLCKECVELVDAEGYTTNGNKAHWFTNGGQRTYFKITSPVLTAVRGAMAAPETRWGIRGLKASAVTVETQHGDENGCFEYSLVSGCTKKHWGQLPSVEVKVTSNGQLLTTTGRLYPSTTGGMNSVIDAIRNIMSEYGMEQCNSSQCL